MGGALFTLELIAESLRGPAASAALGVAAASGAPALGLRVLDLAPAIIEAAPGEAYGSAQGSRVAFTGRGKALVFELPEGAGGALPLWLLALARRPEPGAAAAVLLASACVELGAEAARAAAAARGRAAAPCPFRRCRFGLTAVRDGGCSLTLDCYLRLYAGGHRPLAGGELLLEPSALAPQPLGAPAEPAGRSAASSAADEREAGPVAAAPQRRSAETQTEAEPFQDWPPMPPRPGAGGTAAASTATLLAPVGPQDAAAGPPPQRRDATLTAAGREAFFADEIFFGGGSADASAAGPSPAAEEGDEGVAAAAAVEGSPSGLDATTPSPARRQGDPPDVSPSLHLVSALVRELWQIRSIN